MGGMHCVTKRMSEERVEDKI